MATNKNITMKNYNGTDYDTLYPKTQTSQVLGDWDLTKVSGLLSATDGGTGVSSLDELAINLGLNTQYAQIRSGTYVGTGTYGSSNKSSLTFDFYPHLIYIIPINSTTQPSDISMFWAGQNTTSTYLDNKTLYWYGNTATDQLNVSGTTYAYLGIGASVLSVYEKLITTVGTTTVTLPVSGNYYLELHGGGGGANQQNYSGGGSGQVYNSVALNAGTYTVTIGKGGYSQLYMIDSRITNGGATSFGNYSVAGGNRSVGSVSAAGVGNVGESSKNISSYTDTVNNGGGRYSYYGSGGAVGYDTQAWTTAATSGAVYIRLLSD